MIIRSREPQKIDVLVSTGWNRVGYNVIRSLGRQGLRVGLCDSERFGMSVFSRYVEGFFRHPSSDRDPMGFLETLRNTIRDLKPSVYLPTDEETFLVSKHIDMYSDLLTRIPLSPYHVLESLHNKREIAGLARRNGIPIPETICPENEADVDKFIREFGSPVVLKIIHSSGAKGVFYIKKDEVGPSLDMIMRSHALYFGEFIVQKYVEGVGYGVSMLFNHGKLRAKFTHRRLREKFTTGGTSTVRMSDENPVLEEYAERLLTSVCYHGVAMVEFKYDDLKKKGWLIEVNPRFWGSLALAIHAGVDFPHLLYRMAREGDVEPVLTYRTGVKVKWLLGDIFAVIQQRKFRQNSEKAIFSGVEGYDDFYWDDPVPLFAEFLYYLSKSAGEKMTRSLKKEASSQEVA